MGIFIVTESVFLVLGILPTLTTGRNIGMLDLTERVMKSVIMGCFFTICFIISIINGGKKIPVSQNLQKVGITFLIAGQLLIYVITSIKVITIIYNITINLCSKKNKEKQLTEDEKEYLTQRGLFFYSQNPTLMKSSIKPRKTASLASLFNSRRRRRNVKKFLRKPSSPKDPQIQINYELSEGEEEENRDVPEELREDKGSSSANRFGFLDEPRESRLPQNSPREGNRLPQKKAAKNYGMRDLSSNNLSWIDLFKEMPQRVENKRRRKLQSESKSKNKSNNSIQDSD